MERDFETKENDSKAKQNDASDNSDFKSRYLTDFEPIGCLGKGGYGVVFEAKHKIDDCNYAIKRIALQNSRDSRERVMREVKALAKLDHHNIVRYFNAWLECPPIGWQEEHDKFWIDKQKFPQSEFSTGLSPVTSSKPSDSVSIDAQSHPPYADVGDSFIKFKRSNSGENEERKSVIDLTGCEEEDYSHSKNIKKHKPMKMFLYIQMQLCQRLSLREWLKKQNSPRNIHRILKIFQQIVDAVEYVHLQGLIHRDLKPSNIFFAFDDKVKIGDFGLVTAMTVGCDEVRTPDELQEINNFPTGLHTARVGTHLYMSPEQMAGQVYDYKVDIYSLGIIFYELLVPFSTEMERILALRGLRESSIPKDFSLKYPAEYELLKMMLEVNPQDRATTLQIKRATITLDWKACSTDSDSTGNNTGRGTRPFRPPYWARPDPTYNPGDTQT